MTQLASHRELALFKRVAEILESARGRVARPGNSAMAYWLIGREIVGMISVHQIHKLGQFLGISGYRGDSAEKARRLPEPLPVEETADVAFCLSTHSRVR